MGGVFSFFRFGEKEEREEEIAAEELRDSMAEKRRESLCNGGASNARVELGFRPRFEIGFKKYFL